MQTAIPCVFMRGGTSRGPYFNAADLPADPVVRDRVLLAVMGSPDIRQIDGIGGATSLTSKVAILSRSAHPEAAIDYLFAQVALDRPFVDTSPTCGNILAGVGPFAIETGLVAAEDGRTTVHIRNVNTDSLIEAVVETPGGQVRYTGDTAIDGVPGTGAPVVLNFTNIVGAKTGALLPTGNALDVVEGVQTTCLDVATPLVIIPATEFGKSGHENKAELDADREFLERLESVRQGAARLMGMGDVTGMVLPRVSLIAPPRHDGSISSRYFVPETCHAAHAVSGAICVACCTAVKGSVADGMAVLEADPPTRCRVEHPSGGIDVALDLTRDSGPLDVHSASVVRTARKLFVGYVFVPASVWNGEGGAGTAVVSSL